jgi:signal transduction histidine kinase
MCRSSLHFRGRDAYNPGVAPIKLLRAAGVAAALLSAAPSALRAYHGQRLEMLAFALPIAVFVAAFLYALRDATPKPARRAALLVESVAAVVFTALARGGFAGTLVVVVAGQAPFLLGTSAALVVVAVQTLCLAVIYGSGTSVAQAIVASGGYLAFQLFAAGAAVLAEREAKARTELALANAELLATREAFAATTRTAERLRIARDLHDTMGHRLTALRLQLEVAKNSTDEQRRQAIETAGDVSKLLLDDVREVVSAMRTETAIDLHAVLAPIVAAVPRPKITLSIHPAVHASDPALTHAILRFVQEAVTNAARHAHAETLVIAVEMDGEAVRVTARDDGSGSGPIREGNGLRGLRERFEELGGSLELQRAEGRGLVLRALVPAKAGPA